MAHSHRTGSRSEVGSECGSRVTATSSSSHFVPKAIEKREVGKLDVAVRSALKGGGNVSACLRGGPLSERSCQSCKDVAYYCKESINCKFLANPIEVHLRTQFPKQGTIEEMNDAIFRFIKDLAGSEHTRAKQVLYDEATRTEVVLKASEQRVLAFSKRHELLLKKIGFCQEKLLESKKLTQVEKEVPEFLKTNNLPCEKHDVSALVDMFTTLEEFEPFLAKQRAEAAEKEAGKKCTTMHGDSDIVDKFFAHHKCKGDRAYVKAVLLMSCSK